MKKNRREYKDGSCYKTKRGYIKPKHRIKLELIIKYKRDKFNSLKEYNEFLDKKTEEIYNMQFTKERF